MSSIILYVLAVALVHLSRGAMTESLEEQVRTLQEQTEQLRSIVEQQQRELEELRARTPEETPDRTPSPEEAPPVTEVEDPAVQAGWDDGFYLSSDDDRFRLEIGGRIEPRYEYTRVRGERFRDFYPEADALEWSPTEDLSSVYLRRARLDFTGHIGSERLTFRLYPALGGESPSLRDGWVEYAFSPQLRARFGQKTLPFQWHRFVSSRRQYFVERSLVSRRFGFPAGRDLGLLIHGRNDANTLYYGVGVYDGAGRNRGLSTSRGNVLTGRVGYAPLGELPREEPDLSWSGEPALSLGLGGQAANRNEIRDWDLDRSWVGNTRADWATGTVDARFAWRGFSLVGEAAMRQVRPDDAWVNSYRGYGYSISAGYMLIPGRLGLVGRYSRTRLDRAVRETQETEWGLGANLYHDEHRWKSQLQYLRHDTDESRTHSFILQHTFVF